MQPMSYPSSSESIAEKEAHAFTNGGAPLSEVSSLSDAPPRRLSRPGRLGPRPGFGCACSAEAAATSAASSRTDLRMSGDHGPACSAGSEKQRTDCFGVSLHHLIS